MKKKGYNDSVSNWFIIIALISLIVACTSCATTKTDCRGVKHYKQSGGFYL